MIYVLYLVVLNFVMFGVFRLIVSLKKDRGATWMDWVMGFVSVSLFGFIIVPLMIWLEIDEWST